MVSVSMKLVEVFHFLKKKDYLLVFISFQKYQTSALLTKNMCLFGIPWNRKK
jgi:hypothetical protein